MAVLTSGEIKEYLSNIVLKLRLQVPDFEEKITLPSGSFLRPRPEVSGHFPKLIFPNMKNIYVYTEHFEIVFARPLAGISENAIRKPPFSPTHTSTINIRFQEYIP